MASSQPWFKWVVGGAAGVISLGAFIIWDTKRTSANQRRKDMEEANDFFTLGKDMFEAEKWQVAEQQFISCLEKLLPYLTAEDENRLLILKDLAVCFQKQGKLKDAMECNVELKTLLVMKHGESSPEIVDTLLELSRLEIILVQTFKAQTHVLPRENEVMKEIQSFLLQSKEILAKQGEQHTVRYMTIFVMFSTCEILSKNWEIAKSLALEALEIFNNIKNFTSSKQKGTMHIDVTSTLVKVYHKLKDISALDSLFENIIDDLYKDYDNNKDLAVAYLIRLFGDTYAQLKQFEKAEEKYLIASDYTFEVQEKKNTPILFIFKNYLSHYYLNNLDQDEYKNKGLEILNDIKNWADVYPNLTKSKYFSSSSAHFGWKPIYDDNNEVPSGQEKVQPIYFCKLLPNPAYNKIKDTAYVEIEFEKPNEKNSFLLQKGLNESKQHSGSSSSSFFEVISEPVDGVKAEEMYMMIVHIWKNKRKEEKLGEHYQFFKVPWSSCDIQTLDQVKSVFKEYEEKDLGV